MAHTHQPPPERASERIRRELCSQITDGTLSMGDKLPTERFLSEHYGVSRMVIREALAVMSAEGWLTSRPGFRPVISHPRDTAPDKTTTDFDNTLHEIERFFSADTTAMHTLFESRIFFEKTMARHAAERASKEDIEKLEAALARNAQAIGQRGLFERTDSAFHHLLFTIPGNPLYPLLHDIYRLRLSSYWGRIEGTPEIDQANYQGHQAIFQAIVMRDAQAAERETERHLTVAWELIQAILTLRTPS